MYEFKDAESNKTLTIVKKYFEDENKDNEVITVEGYDYNTIEIDYRRISNKKYSSSNRKISVYLLNELEENIVEDILITFLKNMRKT